MTATLYYQITTREYVEFLRDENRTNDAGQVFYNLWAAGGKSAPEVMAEAAWYRPLVSVAVNGGAAQRSKVTNLVVTFRRLVDIEPGAFQVTQRGTGTPVTVVADAVDQLDQTIVLLTFAGNLVQFGSLADGNYQLLVDTDHVHLRATGQQLDGDSDGTPGGDFVWGTAAADRFSATLAIGTAIGTST